MGWMEIAELVAWWMVGLSLGIILIELMCMVDD